MMYVLSGKFFGQIFFLDNFIYSSLSQFSTDTKKSSWVRPESPIHLSLFDSISASILGYSVNVTEHLREFDEVLKYINDLSMTIDLDSTLVRAEVLFYRFQGTVELIDRKNAERAKQGKEIEGQISEELRGLLKKEYPKE
jgi:hypothetical protein